MSEAKPVLWGYRKAECQALCSKKYLVNMTGATGTDQSSVEQVLVSPSCVAVTIDWPRHGPGINTSNESDPL